MPDTIRQNPTLSTVSTLSPAQQKAVLALAQGSSFTAAAKLAGVHRSTLYEWQDNNPEFKAALTRAIEQWTDSLNDALIDLTLSALAVVRSILQKPDTRDYVRLRAALAILGRPRHPRLGWPLEVPGEDLPEV